MEPSSSNQRETDSSVQTGPDTDKGENERKVAPIMQFFAYKHLPPNLADISRPFCDIAAEMERVLPTNPETSTCLRRILEAKDCAVRAVLFKRH